MNLQAGAQDPPLDRTGPERRGLASRGVVRTAFAISAAAHVVFILMYPSLFPRLDPSESTFRIVVGAPDPSGIEVMEIVEIDVIVEVERPDDPELEPAEVREVSVAAPGIVDGPVVDFARPGITAAERLRPNLRDRRLWAPLPPQFRELSLQQREELALRGRIVEWADSLAAAQAAESRLTDWTYTDDEGKRWGVADGKIYLGDVVLPGTHMFGVPVGKRDEVAQRKWQWDEIMRQSVRYDILESWSERQEAIRERRDLERAEMEPDTTRSRR